MSTLSAAEWNERYPIGTVVRWAGTVAVVDGLASDTDDPKVRISGGLGKLAFARIADLHPCFTDEQRLAEGWLPPAATFEDMRAAGWLPPTEAAELTAERDRLGDRANELVQLAKALREELRELKGSRVLSVVFGHHKGAPRPFALRRVVDETGVSGTGIVATGCEFDDGVVAMRWRSEWPTSVVFHDRGMEAVEAVHGHGGKTEVVWLSEELPTLAEMERRAEAAEAEVERLRAEFALALRAVADPEKVFDLPDDPAWDLWKVAADEWVRQREELRAKLAVQQPVVDAARALVAKRDESHGPNRGEPGWWSCAAVEEIELVRAVDALDVPPTDKITEGAEP